jgi:amino acid transporter
MKGKISIILGFGISILVILTLIIYLTAKESFEFFDITSIVIVLILIVSATYIIWDRLKNIRKGLPAKDERLVQVNYKAGYYGFIAAIWSAVFAPLLFEILFDYELPGSRVTAVVVLVSGFVFIASYLYLVKKGDAK